MKIDLTNLFFLIEPHLVFETRLIYKHTQKPDLLINQWPTKDI